MGTSLISAVAPTKYAASYARVARVPELHDGIGRVLRAGQLRRMNRSGGGQGTGVGLLLLDPQANPSPLRQREGFDWPKRAVAEDGIDVTDHESILPTSDALV